MYADRAHPGYARPGIKPANLLVAIGINAAIFAALAFSAPTLVPRTDKPFDVRNIPLDPVPPPKPEPVREMKRVTPADPRPEPDLFVTRPVVETPSDSILTVTSIPQPPPPIGEPGTGTDIAPRAEPSPPPPLPVMVGAEIDPRYAAAFQPIYPGEERRAGREGRVTVRVLIGTDGRVKQVERVSAATDAFFEATRERALARWRFRPATRDGVAVEAWRTMSVRFELND
ncbi:energy transducer TonB [Sphingomonas aracearum]|uniref:Protein TonB n=1 Tax=Sphingomonas aracearum TaxID=2283317 RepID=A0A369VU09_9SPHN|nr:energy transducer TonB [Sphingomonas aracearum]RDE05848.1 energy transducer TonB [Sphingomonas aracearum]